MAVALLVRRVGQLHEDPAVVARWRAWLGPLLAWLTPRRRRSLLALAALYMVVSQPLREMFPAVDLRSPNGPAAATIVVLACLVAVVAVYLAALRFASLPAAVRGRPQIWLHGVFWALVVVAWLVPDDAGPAAVALSGIILVLPFLLWRMGYLLMSGQRGRVAGARFGDHLMYLYPAYGGTNTPYGKGLDHLARHEATTEDALARSQLAGLKLLILAAIYNGVLGLMAGLVYGDPRSAWNQHGLGLPRLEQMLAASGTPWAIAWASLYVGLVWDVLKLAARGHEIVGILRLFGFNVFRNTYKPLLAPSIVEFWNRYYYYFKELLVEFFFFPTYVRRFRSSPRLRIFAATLAAAGFGNLYYHVLQHDAFMLTLDWATIGQWLLSRGLYCLLLSIGIYVSMRREQGRRGAPAAPADSALTRLRRLAGVWTFFALLSIWADDNVAGFGQRVTFFLALFGVR
ncbi:MAG TPA: hypothetical protein VFT36_12110 [Methylomirabilota bacterium]|nr:hypothetical protein [Methylomirabilota bacterium]